MEAPFLVLSSTRLALCIAASNLRFAFEKPEIGVFPVVVNTRPSPMRGNDRSTSIAASESCTS
jgi:hypothetical protein